MREMIRRVPVPLAGVMLGFAAFGNFLKSYVEIVWIFMELVAAVILALLVLKVFLYQGDFRRDMKNPAIAGASGTFSMGLMFLAVSLKSVSVPAAVFVWWAALVLHAVLIVWFSFAFVRHFQLKNVYMTWFLVYVGIVAAAATSPAFGTQAIGRVLTVYGLAATAVLMVLMAVRYRRIPAEKPLRPLMAICAAPFSLCLVGYQQSFDAKSPSVFLGIFFLSSVFYVIGLIQVFRYIGGPFYPSFSGFTFPFINTAIGTRLTWNALRAVSTGEKVISVHVAIDEKILTVFFAFAGVEFVIAGILLGIVFVRYAAFLLGRDGRTVFSEEERTASDGEKAAELRHSLL
jgi:exfoliative toxin A/B